MMVEKGQNPPLEEDEKEEQTGSRKRGIIGCLVALGILILLFACVAGVIVAVGRRAVDEIKPQPTPAPTPQPLLVFGQCEGNSPRCAQGGSGVFFPGNPKRVNSWDAPLQFWAETSAPNGGTQQRPVGKLVKNTEVYETGDPVNGMQPVEWVVKIPEGLMAKPQRDWEVRYEEVADFPTEDQLDEVRDWLLEGISSYEVLDKSLTDPPYKYGPEGDVMAVGSWKSSRNWWLVSFRGWVAVGLGAVIVPTPEPTPTTVPVPTELTPAPTQAPDCPVCTGGARRDPTNPCGQVCDNTYYPPAPAPTTSVCTPGHLEWIKSLDEVWIYETSTGQKLWSLSEFRIQMFSVGLISEDETLTPVPTGSKEALRIDKGGLPVDRTNGYIEISGSVLSRRTNERRTWCHEGYWK